MLQKSEKFAWDDHQKHSKLLPKSANMRLLKQKIGKNGKICKNHEEKHKIDVKENEKSGEMRGICHPKTGDAGPKTGDLGTPKRARSPYKQHAQKVKKPTAARPERSRSPQQHALKGQKLLAQGNALGIKAISNAPCKGKSFKTHLIKL